ncbi:hypothetical protein [Frondihabitans cladoniiphilus]|uniref:Subtilisin inhibitor-like n=1 Tax=Frondihabitans cladoniiphilus TaxID=715785 RepID=A0ABP8VVZ2_9MICO
MTRRSILILIIGAVLAGGWAVTALVRYFAEPDIYVVITNDSSSSVAFACSPDDALPTPPGHDERLTFGVGKDQLCAAFTYTDSFEYLGCVSVDTERDATVPRQVLSKVLNPVAERDCG